jgi:3D (Asp-Asp-Asp) domain-containing protein
MSMADHRRHIVAADKAVPFGLNVLIDGFDAPFTVRDRGQKVRGRHFDVLMRSHRDAVRWGVQHRDVWIRRIVDVEVHERVALTDAQ